MNHHFFEKPILNSPYKYPNTHWELDTNGQPTHQILNERRPAKYITLETYGSISKTRCPKKAEESLWA